MEMFNPADIADRIIKELAKEYSEMKKLNVMILGKTGTGKSTLINNMFGKEMAETGTGRPITEKIRKKELPNFPLAIYDTPGLELSGENAIDSLLDEILMEITTGIKSGDIGQAIHCIWYCISTPTHRIEKTEIDFIKKFNNKTFDYNVPVVIVQTQSYSKNDAEKLKKEIEKENLPVASVIPVLAQDYDLDEDYVVKAYGLNKLSDITLNVIPETLQKTFIAVQCANLDLKKIKARSIVAGASAAAAATGATPIPFSDAALLVPAQITMLSAITATFGMTIEKSSLIAVLSGTIGTAGATVLGKTVVSNLLKIIPGVGSVVGGVISAATAAAITSALGEAYIVIMIKISKGEMSTDDLATERGKKEIHRIFTEKLKLKRNKDGMPDDTPSTAI